MEETERGGEGNIGSRLYVEELLLLFFPNLVLIYFLGMLCVGCSSSALVLILIPGAVLLLPFLFS